MMRRMVWVFWVAASLVAACEDNAGETTDDAVSDGSEDDVLGVECTPDGARCAQGEVCFEQACVSPDTCNDPDGDGYGAGPGCLSADCDESSREVNPGAAELCNERDDDCDQEVDEDFAAELEEVCEAGLGVCQAVGLTICAEDGQGVTCNAIPGEPGVETCNGRDDDCNGALDDGIDCTCTEGETRSCYSAAPETIGVGVCQEGTQECGSDGTYGPCEGEVLPSSELCGEEDLNCNGLDDDACPILVAGQRSMATPNRWSDLTYAPSCADYRFPSGLKRYEGAVGDGIYFIDPDGDSEPTRVYCDMTTDGGGWTYIWKNNGGPAAGGARSNDAVWSGAGVAYLAPYTEELGSEKHELWDHFVAQRHHEWIKIGGLYEADGTEAHTQTIRVDLGSARFQDVVDQVSSISNDTCGVLEDWASVYVNGPNFIGRTRHLKRFVGVGLANTGNGGADRCDQTDDALINDESQIIRMVDTAGTLGTTGGLNSIRHLFSYSHFSAGQNASRCFYRCWSGTEAHYDAFVWAVRRRPPRLVAGWDFDGDLSEETGTFPATVDSGEATFEEGVRGQALRFDGATALVVGEDEALEPRGLSVALWVKADASQPEANALLIDKQHTQDSGWYVQLDTNTGVVRFGICAGGEGCQVASSTTDLMDDAWHHVAGTYDGDTLRVYIDGALEGELDWRGAARWDNDNPVTMGRYLGSTSPSQGFSGLLDAVRVYNAPLSAEAVGDRL